MKLPYYIYTVIFQLLMSMATLIFSYLVSCEIRVEIFSHKSCIFSINPNCIS